MNAFFIKRNRERYITLKEQAFTSKYWLNSPTQSHPCLLFLHLTLRESISLSQALSWNHCSNTCRKENGNVSHYNPVLPAHYLGNLFYQHLKSTYNLSLKTQHWSLCLSQVCYCFDWHDSKVSIVFQYSEHAIHLSQNWVFITGIYTFKDNSHFLGWSSCRQHSAANGHQIGHVENITCFSEWGYNRTGKFLSTK